MTIALAGSLILTSILIINTLFKHSEPALIALFSLVVGIMFYEHKRRMKLLELPKYLSLTWVLYLLLILLTILFF